MCKASKGALWIVLLELSCGGLGLAADWRTPEATLTLPSSLSGSPQNVAISGNIAVVATKTAVVVYTRANGVWDSGNTIFNSKAGDPPLIAVDGNYVAASIHGSDAISVYMLSGTTWALDSEIQPDLSPFSVSSLALSGTTLLVGSTYQDQGLVYVRGKLGWGLQSVLAPSNPNQLSDSLSVALSGDTAVIGDDGYGNLAGGVFVFSRTTGVWAPQLCSCGSASSAVISVPNSLGLGNSIALDGDTLLIGAYQSAYAFFRQGGFWTQQAGLLTDPSAASPGISGNVAIFGLAPSRFSLGGVQVFVRNGQTWIQQQPLAGAQEFGAPAAISGDTLLAGSPVTGDVYVFRLWNVSVTSIPPGRTFTLSGSGCPAGSFPAPYTGLWTDCTLEWNSPDLNTPVTRYTFQNWADGGTQNSRSFSIPGTALDNPYAYTADFLTEYQLTTQAIPQSGGSVTGSGWYTAGTSATVAAIPNPGFLFTGFSGALAGFTTPQTVGITGPKTVTGSFTATPPAVLNGIVSAKSGTASDRIWTISIANAGPGTAYNAQLFGLAFTQTYGAACTALPVRLTPAAFPVSLGNLPPQAQAQAQVALDFTGCPATARFLVSIGYMSNGGASVGMIQLANQFQ